MLNYIDVNLHSSSEPQQGDVSSHQAVTTPIGKRWKEARTDAGLSMNALDRLIGQGDGGGYSTRVESGDKKNPETAIVERAAKVLKVRPEWLALGSGTKHHSAESFGMKMGVGDEQMFLQDPPVGTFLLKLHRLPRLREWLEANPTRLTITQLAQGMAIYDEHKPRAREDGEPFPNGWDGFFDDALAGRITKAGPGNVSAAEALERKQLPRSARKRLRSASKKA